MAGLNKKSDIGVHKADFHSDVLTVRKNSAPVSAALLYEAEDVIPSVTRAINNDIAVEKTVMKLPATIQPGRVVSQLEKDLFHLESGGERFD